MMYFFRLQAMFSYESCAEIRQRVPCVHLLYFRALRCRDGLMQSIGHAHGSLHSRSAFSALLLLRGSGYCCLPPPILPSRLWKACLCPRAPPCSPRAWPLLRQRQHSSGAFSPARSTARGPRPRAHRKQRELEPARAASWRGGGARTGSSRSAWAWMGEGDWSGGGQGGGDAGEQDWWAGRGRRPCGCCWMGRGGGKLRRGGRGLGAGRGRGRGEAA